MARDLPDWGAQSAQVTVHEITDLGELAVRLGSIVSHDRRGDVVWYDEFECGLDKWEVSAVGTGSAAALSTDRAHNGETSCKLTAGSDSTRRSECLHRLAIPAYSLWGFECAFNLSSSLDYLDKIVALDDGVNLVLFVLRWDRAAGELQYGASGGGYTTIATIPHPLADDTLFHVWKLVVDLSKRTYIRAILNETEYDLADAAAAVAGTVGAVSLSVKERVTGRSGQNDIVYVDDVILTQNEPPNV